jgi:lipooligosaccharide transport system permease protein
MAAVWRECQFWLIRYRRMWVSTLVLNVINPVLFLLAIGLGLGQLVDANPGAHLGGLSYLAFFAPGLLAASTMQSAVMDASRPVHVSVGQRGNYRLAAVTPMRPEEIFLGHLAYMALKITLSVVAFVAVMALFPDTRSSRLGWLVPCALLTGLAFAAPVAAWAVTVVRPAQFSTAFRLAVMPMYMLSGTFFDVGQLPEVARWAVAATPLYHGTELCRAVSTGSAAAGGVLLHAGCLVLLTVAGIFAAMRTYRRTLYR